jgi:hypothetical protein
LLSVGDRDSIQDVYQVIGTIDVGKIGGNGCLICIGYDSDSCILGCRIVGLLSDSELGGDQGHRGADLNEIVLCWYSYG